MLMKGRSRFDVARDLMPRIRSVIVQVGVRKSGVTMPMNVDMTYENWRSCGRWNVKWVMMSLFVVVMFAWFVRVLVRMFTRMSGCMRMSVSVSVARMEFTP